GNVGQGRLEEPAIAQLHLIIRGHHELARAQVQRTWRCIGEEDTSGLVIGVQPCPGETSTKAIIGAVGNQGERGQDKANVLPAEQGVGVVGTELIEAANTAVVPTGVAEPEPLRAEEIHAVGAIHLAATERVEPTGLSPDTDADVARLALS